MFSVPHLLYLTNRDDCSSLNSQRLLRTNLMYDLQSGLFSLCATCRRVFSTMGCGYWFLLPYQKKKILKIFKQLYKYQVLLLL